jgi:integrase
MRHGRSTSFRAERPESCNPSATPGKCSGILARRQEVAVPALTDALVRRLKAPSKGRLELRDRVVKGLIFRLTAAGIRSFSVLYRVHGQARRFTIGDYRTDDSSRDGFTIAAARSKARSVLRAAAEGHDPEAEKVKARADARRQGSTLADVSEVWLSSSAAEEWRPKTRMEFERIVRREIVPELGDLGLSAVTKAHVRTLYDRIEARSESMAKHALAVLRIFFAWAAEEDHVDAVPLFPKRGGQTRRRSRVLAEAELRAVVAALEAGVGPLTEAFRLMLVTRQRRGEVLSMRWADITEEADGAWWTIPAERHKRGREHRVPLTRPAVEALTRLHELTASEWLFPSPKRTAAVPFVGNPQKAATRLWRRAGVEGAHVHDLRRTAATYMVRLGVPRLVVGRVLGHADADVTGRYDTHAYDREKRAALVKWADELARLVADEQGPVENRVLPWVR